MEKKIAVRFEQSEKRIGVKRGYFMLARSQAKTVPLSMANGDQVISPDSGYLLDQVTVVCPDTYIEENIREGVNIGGKVGTYAGVELPDLNNPASDSDVFSGKEYIDADGYKQTGSFAYPHLDTPATTNKVFSGYEYLDGDGVKRSGSFSYPTLTTPASSGDVFVGKEYIDGSGVKQTGTFAYPVLLDAASAGDVLDGKEFLDGSGIKRTGTFALPTQALSADVSEVVVGKEFIDYSGAIKTGTLNPDVWSSNLLMVYHTTATISANSVNTTLGVKDYVLEKAGVDANRVLAFSLREKASYQIGEIGRSVLYPNSSIGYFTCSQWTASGWGTGRMLSGYSATLPAGGVYDVYYWGIPS